MRNVVIVGASLAGVSAAEALREHGYGEDITLVSSEADLPYDKPPLSKEVLLERTDPTQLWLRPPSWYDDNAISLLLETRARGVDPADSEIHFGGGSSLKYDSLIIATGSVPRRVGWPGRFATQHTIRSLQDALRFREELRPGGHVVLIGGGFIGLEVAANVRQLGLEVTVIESGPAPLARLLGDTVGAWYRRLHERHGVRMICGRSVESVKRHRGTFTVSLSDGSHVSGDLVLTSAGARPSIDWLRGSSIPTADGVMCKPDLSTSVPGVFAAGDVARWYNPTFDEEMRVEHWSNAVDQGRHTARTILGFREAFAAVPYFWSDQYDARTRFVGRSVAAGQVHIEAMTDNQLTVLYGRDGLVVGALCVNNARSLARFRRLIHEHTPWDDVVDGTSTTLAGA